MSSEEETVGQLLRKVIGEIRPLDHKAQEDGKKRWMSLAKPLDGLGVLEDYIIQICGMRRNLNISLDKKMLLIACADNGVVEEGISQTDSSVTAVVTNNFSSGKTSACLMAESAGVEVLPVDVGVLTDTSARCCKVMYGTRNMAKEPAMTREQAIRTVENGIRLAMECREKGAQILLTGEMGIGNTTTSSAVASVLLQEDPSVMAGKGAGLSEEGLRHKREVIRKAIRLHHPDPGDPLGVLASVGGLDLAALAGIFLGGAWCRIPVVMDGFISAVAALLAVKLQPLAGGYILPSHLSREPGMQRVLEALEKQPVLDARMKLGEGTGAVALMPLLDMALKVYREMPTFEGIDIAAYTPFEEGEDKCSS